MQRPIHSVGSHSGFTERDLHGTFSSIHSRLSKVEQGMNVFLSLQGSKQPRMLFTSSGMFSQKGLSHCWEMRQGQQALVPEAGFGALVSYRVSA
jgi:hypothetical protein